MQDDKSVERIRKNAENISNVLYESLVVKAPVNTLPENIFKEVFLPYFIGEKNIVEDSQILNTWIGIAGNPGNPVDIVNDANEVLFRVPPLFPTDFINNTPERPLPYDGIIQQYETRAAVLPEVGKQFLDQALNVTKKTVMTTNTNVEKYKDMWNNVFNHYNIPIPNGDNSKKEQSALDPDEIAFE